MCVYGSTMYVHVQKNLWVWVSMHLYLCYCVVQGEGGMLCGWVFFFLCVCVEGKL